MKRPRFIRTLLAIIIFIVLVVVLHMFGYLKSIERPLGRMLHNASSRVYTISVWKNEIFETRTMTGDELQAAFVELQEKYRTNIVDQAELSQLKEEYSNIKKQINFFSEKKWDYVTARITGKNVDPFESSVYLFFQNAESRISVGAPAITENGVFVGVVKKVEGDIVTVRLLGDGQTKIGVALLNDERTIGVVEGGFGKSIRMNFIPQNENVSAGDIVVSSGLTEHIPYGLPIGTVEAVEKEPYQPFQSAVISSLANPNTLRILSIIVVTDDIQ
jgi:rod shape-determining protein MreC